MPRSGRTRRAARFAGRRGKGRKVGINENLAREILELHTLGVDGGYTQADVTTFAQAISGWSIGGEDNGRRLAKLGVGNGTPGEFFFREAFHEPGAKTVVRQQLCRRWRVAGRGHPAGPRAAPADRAAHRDQARAAFHRRRSAGRRRSSASRRPGSTRKAHLPTVYEALVESPEAWEQPLAKFKTPADYIYSSYRALGIPLREKRRALQAFEALGQRNLMPGSPAGWPDTSADWDGSSALLKRIAWADVVAQRMGDARNARELAPQLLGATLDATTPPRRSRAPRAARRR